MLAADRRYANRPATITTRSWSPTVPPRPGHSDTPRSRPVPSRPVPSRPVPSRPVPHRHAAQRRHHTLCGLQNGRITDTELDELRTTEWTDYGLLADCRIDGGSARESRTAYEPSRTESFRHADATHRSRPILFPAVPSHTRPSCTVPSGNIQYQTAPYRTVPVPSGTIQYQTAPYRTVPVPSGTVLSHPVLYCPVLYCPVLSYPVLSQTVPSSPQLYCLIPDRHVLSYPIQSCIVPDRPGPQRYRTIPSSPVLSCPVMSCIVLSCIIPDRPVQSTAVPYYPVPSPAVHSRPVTPRSAHVTFSDASASFLRFCETQTCLRQSSLVNHPFVPVFWL